MENWHKWLLIVSVIGATMFRAHYYGYAQGVWSWIIVITFVVPFVTGLWPLVGFWSAVYAVFHITFYEWWGLGGHGLDFGVKVLIVCWSAWFSFDVWLRQGIYGWGLKKGG